MDDRGWSGVAGLSPTGEGERDILELCAAAASPSLDLSNQREVTQVQHDVPLKVQAI